MHARLILLSVAAVVGCAQDNPAFTSSGGADVGTSVGGSGEESGVESGVESADGQPGACELNGGEPLTIELAPGCNWDDPQAYDRTLRVVSVEGSTWWVGGCTDLNCVDCELGTPLPMKFDPVPVANLAGVDSCLHVSGRRLTPVNPDACDFNTVVVWDVGNGGNMPLLVARNDEGVLLPDLDPSGTTMLSAFQPGLVLVEQCACADYPDDCCDGLAPAVFEFEVGQPETVKIGAKTALVFDNIEYEFWGLDAFSSGECDDPRHVSWALTRK